MPYLARPDDCRLYHELHGPEDASPLILLEGMGGDIPGWRRNIPHLATEHRVVGYDFRGNGRSDKPAAPVTMGTFVDDTVALLDHLALSSVHAYGQSFGGMVAQEMALTLPEQVASLVLACTHAGRRQWEAIQAWDAWDRLGDIRCPTLVLHGTEDRLISPRNARMLAERIPGATLFLLDGAGYVYHSEQPEAADRVVLDFLRTVDGQR